MSLHTLDIGRDHIRDYVKQDYDVWSSLEFEEDSFNSFDYDFNLLPNIKDYIEECLNEQGYRLRKRNQIRQGTSVPAGKFNIQKHNSSVEEHVDDACLFGIFVLEIVYTTIPTLAGYDRYPALHYCIGRSKMVERLKIGNVVVFNPKRPHSLIHYGNSPTMLLFSCEKIRK
jgi:hypothetical protein